MELNISAQASARQRNTRLHDGMKLAVGRRSWHVTLSEAKGAYPEACPFRGVYPERSERAQGHVRDELDEPRPYPATFFPSR
jgi:hypothetical protein